MPNFEKVEIGPYVIQAREGLGIDHSYENLGDPPVIRMMNGRGARQQHWRKLKVALSAEGMMPPGLAMLAALTQYVLKCGMHRAVNSTTNVITITPKRRTDTGYTPFGFGFLSDHSTVSTPVAMAGDVATLTVVAGAVGYQVCYYPQITVYVAEVSDDGNTGSKDSRWSMTCEEV